MRPKETQLAHCLYRRLCGGLYGEWAGGEMRGRIKMVDSGGVRGGLDKVNEPYMAHRVGGSKYL